MKKILMVFVLSMFLITLVSAVPPFTENVGTSTEGLQIFTSKLESAKYNTTYNIHFHVSNISNGLQLNNTVVDCNLHLYTMDGSHLLESPIGKDSNGVDHELTITYGNFTEYGEFNGYYVWCNSTDGLGGEVKGTYEITENGKPTPNGAVVVGFSFVLLLIFVFGIVWLVRVIALLSNLEVDLIDVGYLWGVYFALLMLSRLEYIYLGSVEIGNWLNLFVTWGGIPFILLPMVAFFISLINAGIQKKKDKAQEGWNRK